MGFFDKKTPEEKAELEWQKSIKGSEIEAFKEEIYAENYKRVAYIAANKKSFSAPEFDEVMKVIAARDDMQAYALFYAARADNMTEQKKGFVVKHVIECDAEKIWGHLSDNWDHVELATHAVLQGHEERVPELCERIASAKKETSRYYDRLYDVSQTLSDDYFVIVLKTLREVGYDRFNTHGTPTSWLGTKMLEQQCAMGTLSRVSALLASGVEKSDAAFLNAMHNGHIVVLQKLIDCGLNPKAYASKIKTFLHCTEGLSAEYRDYLSNIAKEKQKKDTPSSLMQESDDGYISPDIDMLSKTVTLPNGLSLTTVFNFAHSEKILVTERADPPLMTTIVTAFSDMTDPRQIQAAEEKLVKMNRRSDVNRGGYFGKV